MNDRITPLDPRDPRTPLETQHAARPSDPLAYDPIDPVPVAPRSSARTGIVLLAMVAALFVIGFIAFSGPDVDENPTATIPAQEEELLPSAEPLTPNPTMTQPEAPAATPAPTEMAPATPATPAPIE
jgi:hypothetical protein